ncbi:MAG: type II secretion system protein N, partial [Pseudomonadota bacterium]
TAWGRAAKLRWPQILEVGFIVGLAYVTSLLVWTFLAPDPRPAAGAGAGVAPVSGPARSSRDVAALTQFDPFHRSLPTAAPDRAAEEAAPETALDLELFGIRAGEDGEIGSATIRGLDKQQRAYVVGEEVGEGSGVYLRRILPDRAVISNRGVLESLFFPNADPDRRRAPPADRPQEPAAPPEPARETSAVIPGDFELLSAAFEARPLLADDGETFVGVTLSPRGDGGLFAQAGLEPGDRLLSVNGAGAETAEEALAAFDGLAGESELRLELLRGGESWTVTVKFEDRE